MTDELPPFKNATSEELRQFIEKRPAHNPLIMQALNLLIEGMTYMENFTKVEIAMAEGIIALTIAKERLRELNTQHTDVTLNHETILTPTAQETSQALHHAHPEGQPHRQGQTSRETESVL